MLEKSNLRGIVQIGIHISIIICLILTSLFTNNYFFLVLLFLFNGVVFSFLTPTGAIHELVHSTVFQSRIANKVCYEILCILTWTNATKFRFTHFYHHKNFGAENDIESQHALFNNKQFILIFYYFFVDIRLLISKLRYLYSAIVGEVKSENLKKILGSEVNEKKFITRERFTYFINITLFFIFLAFQQYKLIFMISLAPFTCTIFSKILARLQHIKIYECELNNVEGNSTSLILNPFFEFLYWNMNYHIEHHLYPGVPFFNLPKLSNKLLSMGETAKNRVSLVRAVKILNTQTVS